MTEMCQYNYGKCTAPATECIHWMGTFCELDVNNLTNDELARLRSNASNDSNYGIIARISSGGSDISEIGKDARERLFPVGIMLGFPFDPNRADDMPGEWERVSTIWRRVK